MNEYSEGPPTPPQQQVEQDEIDYFLAHEDARPDYGRNRTILDAKEELAEEIEQLKGSLLELAVTAVSSSVKFFSQVALRRVMCLVTVQHELVKDGRLPKVFGDAGRGASPAAFGRRVWNGVLAAPRLGLFVCRGGGGLSALLRGGGAHACFTLANYALRSTQGFLLGSTLHPFVQRHLRSSTARVLWLFGVFPLLTVLSSWPLKAMQSLVMTNYMADLVAPVGGHASGKGGLPGKHRVGEEEEEEEEEEAAAYLYSGVSELWRVLHRRLGGWTGILGYGLGVELVHSYSVIAVRLLQNEVLTRLFARVQRAEAGETSFFTRPLLLVLAVNGLSTLGNVILRPFNTVSTRMALLSLSPSPLSSSPSGAERPQGVAQGRRYRSGLDCVRTIVKEEGVLALWVGTPQVVAVSMLLPIVQMLLSGAVGLSFADYRDAT